MNHGVDAIRYTLMNMSPVQRKAPRYAKELNSVDPKINDLLPDPMQSLYSTLGFNVKYPFDRNYEGKILSHQDDHTHIVARTVDIIDGERVAFWVQMNWHPLEQEESRAKLVKEAFGLSDEELKNILESE